MDDPWDSGDRYEPYVGRWSRLVAWDFVEWVGAPIGARWMDVGCGTGALTSAILARTAPATVVAVEPSADFAAWAQRHIDDPRVRFEVTDAEHLPPTTVDVVVSGLVLNFVPDPPAAAAAMGRAAPDGTVAAYVWDYSGRMDLMRRFWDAAVALDPAAADLHEATRFSICRPDHLEALWTDAGFADVSSRAIDVPTLFRDFDDYWSPFLGGQGPAAGYAMSLDEERRNALRERLRAAVPAQADGSIPMIARAWAVRGRATR